MRRRGAGKARARAGCADRPVHTLGSEGEAGEGAPARLGELAGGEPWPGARARPAPEQKQASAKLMVGFTGWEDGGVAAATVSGGGS
jgi:hypothetical protein